MAPTIVASPQYDHVSPAAMAPAKLWERRHGRVLRGHYLANRSFCRRARLSKNRNTCKEGGKHDGYQDLLHFRFASKVKLFPMRALMHPRF
jgi:hypothetical protein